MFVKYPRVGFLMEWSHCFSQLMIIFGCQWGLHVNKFGPRSLPLASFYGNITS